MQFIVSYLAHSERPRHSGTFASMSSVSTGLEPGLQTASEWKQRGRKRIFPVASGSPILVKSSNGLAWISKTAFLPVKSQRVRVCGGTVVGLSCPETTLTIKVPVAEKRGFMQLWPLRNHSQLDSFPNMSIINNFI